MDVSTPIHLPFHSVSSGVVAYYKHSDDEAEPWFWPNAWPRGTEAIYQ